MSKNSYILCQKVITVALAVAISISVVLGNAIIPIVAVFAGLGVLYICRRQVKEVLADERNYRINEKASRLTIAVFAPTLAILSAVLLALANSSYPELKQAAYTLAYTACALALLQRIFYVYYERKI